MRFSPGRILFVLLWLPSLDKRVLIISCDLPFAFCPSCFFLFLKVINIHTDTETKHNNVVERARPWVVRAGRANRMTVFGRRRVLSSGGPLAKFSFRLLAAVRPHRPLSNATQYLFEAFLLASSHFFLRLRR